MRVEVLYVTHCPYHLAAVEQLRKVLREEGIAAEIHEVAVKDSTMAEQLKFRGSPTVRINGVDVAGESDSDDRFGLSCRIYSRARDSGVPPVEWMRRAVREARARR